MHKRMFLVTIISIGVVFLLLACGGAAPTEEPAVTKAPEAGPTARIDSYPNGVEIELPNQESGATLQSKETVLAFPLPGDTAGGYEFVSPILYLDVYDEGEKLVNSFSPPIVFSADIPDDMKSIAEAQELVILLYDQEVKQWIPCDGNEETQTPRTQCSETTIDMDLGRASITISSWTSGTGWGKR